MLGDIEDVTHQIAIVLAGDAFAARLVAIDAEKGGEPISMPPAEVWEGEKATPTAYPSAQIIGRDTEFDAEAQPTLQDGLHRLEIVWLAVSDDEIKVTKMVQRLVLATRQALWSSLLGSGINAGPVEVTREDYSDLAVSDQAFLKGGRLMVNVRTLVQ